MINAVKKNSIYPVAGFEPSGSNCFKNEWQAEYLEKFFIKNLETLLWSEREWLTMLPGMVRILNASAMREIFERQLIETHTHITRLKKNLSVLGAAPKGRQSAAMVKMFEKMQEVLNDGMFKNTHQLVLLFLTQKVMHHQIATYRSMAALAGILNQKKIAETLTDTLKETKAVNAKLVAAPGSLQTQ
jgi:ferritin-like metal-binding protein YciE